MTTPTYTISAEPFWYFVDPTGLPAGGGSMETWSSQNPTVHKPVYQTDSDAAPCTNPVLFNLNGVAFTPFYWEFDPANPDDGYNIIVKDAKGNVLWQIDNYFPTGATGGGGDVTTNLNFTNLVINNDFYRNIGASANPTASDNVFLAPSSHSSFASSIQPGNQPDIRFIKNNTSATDNLTFSPFTQGGNILTGDITPPVFLNYTCGGAGSSETKKWVQYPISQDLQSTSGQNCSVTIWARCNSGNASVSFSLLQFFGDGGSPSASVKTVISTETLTAAWTQYEYNNVVIPAVNAATYGTCGNTGLYLLVELPLNATTNIDHVRASLYLSAVTPDLDYLTQDQVDSVINTPRTGDVRISLNSFSPYGWLLCNDGTIGSASSGADRANIDTFPLYDCIWNQITKINATTFGYARLYNSGGALLTYADLGASSMADYAANRRLGLTKVLGRALASQGLPSSGGQAKTWALGLAQGEELHVLTVPELAPHVHALGETFSSTNAASGSGVNAAHAGTENTGSTGSGAGHNTIQPTSYFNVFLKL